MNDISLLVEADFCLWSHSLEQRESERERPGLFFGNTKQRKAHIGQEVSADENKHSQASILRYKWLPPQLGTVLKSYRKSGRPGLRGESNGPSDNFKLGLN